MGKGFLLFGILMLVAAGVVQAQQVPDLNYNPPIPRPAYEPGLGPRVAIDEAHYNFHTAEGDISRSPSPCGGMVTAWTASRSRSRRPL